MAITKHLRKVLTPPVSRSRLKASEVIKAIRKVDKKYQDTNGHKHIHQLHATHL